MFVEEEEWNDDPDAEALTSAVSRGTERLDSANVTPKGVGKRSLLRTLQTLGSAPEWTNGFLRQDSDSEGEGAPSSSKRKKKRSKKRKRTRAAGNEGEETGKSESKEEDPGAVVAKKKPKEAKSTRKSIQEINTGKPEIAMDRLSTDSHPAKTDVGGDKLSRQQWRNRLKMKKNSKNKFRPPDEMTGTAKKANPEPPKPGAGESAMPPPVLSREEQTALSRMPKGKNAKALKPDERKEMKRVKRKEGGKEESGIHPVDTQAGTDRKRRRNGKVALGEESEGAAEPLSKAVEPEARDKLRTETVEKGARTDARESREKRVLAEKLRHMLHGGGSDGKQRTAEQEEEEAEKEGGEEEDDDEAKADAVIPDRSSALRSRMEQRLESARFRYLNEQLYTSTSREAKRLFQQDPGAFGVYHRGYTAQVQHWPVNPVDAIISFIKHKPVSLVVADFGCGDCKIARSVKNKVHSFDLAPACDLVTVCDMAHVPLGNATVDIAVFCLSLMGTNLGDFLMEANRVLVMGGTLKIAEVASRFENVRGFLGALSALGFKQVSKDTENSHFYSFEFVKTGPPSDRPGGAGLQLRPCVYKKR